MKNSPEIVRSSLLPFFNNAADDLANLVENLEIGRFSHVKGTITRGATSLNYVHMVLLPVLSSLFDHVGLNQFGNDLIGKNFNYGLYILVKNLEIGRFSHVKGTITRGATSLNYVHMVLLPVLSSLFDHVGLNQFGNDLIGKF